MTAFERYIGISYSGAETPKSSLEVSWGYVETIEKTAAEAPSPPSPRKYLARRRIAEWLIERLAEDVPTLVGPPDQHDAYNVATWLREADREGRSQDELHFNLSPPECGISQVKGRIFLGGDARCAN